MKTLNYGIYEEQIGLLAYMQGLLANAGQCSQKSVVREPGWDDDTSRWSEEKAKHEATKIRARLRKVIDHYLADDPYAHKVFGVWLKQVMTSVDAIRYHPRLQYALFEAFEQLIITRTTPGVPLVFGGNFRAQAYYGAIRLALGEAAFANTNTLTHREYVDLAFEIDRIVRDAIAKHPLAPAKIKAAIRAEVLSAASTRVALQSATVIIDHVIHITRVMLSRQ